jgi:hypothetical protein
MTKKKVASKKNAAPKGKRTQKPRVKKQKSHEASGGDESLQAWERGIGEPCGKDTSE